METKAKQISSSQDCMTRNIGPSLRICQLNVEGLSRAKCEVLSKILREHKIDIATIQETHVGNETDLKSRGKLPGYEILGATYHHIYGCLTYIRSNIENARLVSTNISNNNIHTITVKIEELTVANIYKPPLAQWLPEVLPQLPHPAIYVGDFNSHHTMWKYKSNDHNGETLMEWADQNNLSLIFDAKDRGTFRSAAWNREYNPDLCFSTQNTQNQPVHICRRVLENFPHSQHRPVVYEMGIQIPIIRSIPRPRWNFQKADWTKFSLELDKIMRWIPAEPGNYDRFAGAVIAAAKKSMPRGYRKEYIPGWNAECEELYNNYIGSDDPDVANDLVQALDEARKDKWAKTTEEMNFQRSSRKSWSLLKKLGGSNPPMRETDLVSPDQIASRIITLSRAPRNKHHTKQIKKELSNIRQTMPRDTEFSRQFTTEELTAALRDMKTGKAPGFDGVHPEFLLHCGEKTKKWLTVFYSRVLASGVLPKAFKLSKIIAVLKPNKPRDKVESYRPIALLSCCYKLLERLLLNRLGARILEHIPPEQAGFRPNRSCVDQVLSLTTHIEAGFQKQQKTAVAFVDLTAAYDTVWKEGLLYKLAKIVPCYTTLRLINNMLSDRHFQVNHGNNLSKQRKLNNGLPQGSVLAPMFFNLYISDLPETDAIKFGYADDLALAVQHEQFEPTEHTLTNDLNKLYKYLTKWRLIPNLNKTEVSCFHLNNNKANYELEVKMNNTVLPYQRYPKYLGVILDRTLSFKKHLETTAQKISTRNNIIQKLCSTSWGASANTLRTSALSLVYSAAEYCAPVWLNSAHTKKVDTQLNISMRTISGCIKTTPSYWLPTLSHIPPPALRRQDALIKEYKKITSNTQLPIHMDIPDLSINRLRSRKPPILSAQQLVANDFSINSEWRTLWTENAAPDVRNLIDPVVKPDGFDQPRRIWKTLNRIRTGQGVCAHNLHKWGKRPNSGCDCGNPNQTIGHIVTECELRAYQGDLRDFFHTTQSSLEWIAELDLLI